MTNYIQTGTTAVPYVLDGNDSLAVLGTLTGDISATGETNSVLIDGTVINSLGGYTITYQGIGSESSLYVGQAGAIRFMGTGGTAVLIGGSVSTGREMAIENHGQIYGANGIDLAGPDNTDILNYGTVTSTGSFAAISFAAIKVYGDNTYVRNFGAVSANDIGILVVGTTSDRSQIFNHGTIAARDALTAEAIFALDLTNTGLVSGDIKVGSDRFVFDNTGIVTGDVNAGGVTDFMKLTNAGDITGFVFMSDQDDTYIARNGGTATQVRGEGGADLMKDRPAMIFSTRAAALTWCAAVRVRTNFTAAAQVTGCSAALTTTY